MDDVLSVFSHYQKKLQSDSITVLDIDTASDHMKKRIATLEETPLLGGWVAAINEQFVHQENEEVSLKGVILLKPRKPSRKEDHLYLSDTSHRSSPTIIHEVAASLIGFIKQRTEIDKELKSLLKPFVALSPAVDLKRVHKGICDDLELAFLLPKW